MSGPVPRQEELVAGEGAPPRRRPTVRAGLARAAKIAGAWLVILTIGLAGIEVYIRKTRPHPYFYELDRLKVYNRKFYEQRRSYFENWPIPLELFDADTPTPRYLFKPNLRMAVRGGHLDPAEPGEPVYRSTNSWGFRGPEFESRKPAGLIRIVCLGASTTEGSHGDLETYPHFLQQELNRMFPGRRIEVLNAGHHGQQIADLLDILRLRVLPLDPDLVIFYEAVNDIRFHEFSRIDRSCEPRTCLQKGYQGAVAALHQRSMVVRRVAAHTGRPDLPARPLWHRFDETTPKPGAVHYRKMLRQIVRETLARRSRVVLSSFVTVAHEGLVVDREDNALLFDHLYRKRYPFTPGELERAHAHYNRVARELAQEHGLPFVDAAAEFPRDVKYFPYDTIHFNAEGNRILAGIFARSLGRSVLPDLVTPATR
ncbi:MAG: SGNH/GDSL hydrolase family protein [Armatimonadota bacterium]